MRPLEGISAELTRGQLAAWRARGELAYRGAPPGVVVGAAGRRAGSTCGATGSWRGRAPGRPSSSPSAAPYLIAKTVADVHYPRPWRAWRWRSPSCSPASSPASTPRWCRWDEPNLPGSPQGRGAGGCRRQPGAGRGPRARRGAGRCSLCFGQLRRADDPARRLRPAARLHERPAVPALGAGDHAPTGGGVGPACARCADDLKLGLGVIDVKDPADRGRPTRWRAASRRWHGPWEGERIGYLHPDCGLRMLPGAGGGRRQAAGRWSPAAISFWGEAELPRPARMPAHTV